MNVDSSRTKAPVEGVCPVLATPFEPTGEVDYSSFASLLDHVVAAGVRGVMYPGFASEYHKLSDLERQLAVSELLERVPKDSDFATVISVQDHATHLAVKRAAEAAESGASAINVLPPGFLSPSREAVHRHLVAVAKAVSPVPVIVQLAPALNGTGLDAPAISRLTDAAPNVVQVKVESTPPGRLISALSSQRPPVASVVGYAGVQLMDALRRRVHGVQPGSAFVEIYSTIWQAWMDGMPSEAFQRHQRLLPYISYWMQDVELLIAAEKRILHRRGIIRSEYCRGPRYEFDFEEEWAIDRFLDEFQAELGGK